MVNCFRELGTFIWNTWIEDKLHTLTKQPGHVTVCQLCRITFRFTWDGFDTKFVDLTVGSRREYHLIFQLRKEGEPERIVLEHIQDSRDTYFTADSLIGIKRCVTEDFFVFVIKQVRDIFFILLLSDTTFATVTADILAAAGETVDGQTAAVGTSLTVCHAGRVFQIVDLVDGEHRGIFAILKTLSCDQGCTERTHDTCDIRADRFTVGDLFKASQYRIVIECTTLYDDIFSKLGSIGYFDNFVQRVLDNRVSQTGGDISDGSALFLCLFYFGVHEYGTSGTEVDRIFRK